MALVTPALLTLGILSLVTWYFTCRYYTRSQLSSLKNCRQCPHYPHKDLFGKDLHDAMIQGMLSGSFLKFRQSLYAKYGKTYAARFWFDKQLYTMDLKNMQTILALDFDSYGVEDLRMPTSGDWLGNGVFTTDGPFWKHARDSIKPIFARAQISDLKTFGKHVDRLMELLPTNGSTVDLQPLFLRLVSRETC